MVGRAADHRRMKGKGEKRRALEFIFARQRIRRGINECGVRAALRNNGPLAHRPGSVQLQCARYGQYGSARPLWHRGAKEKVTYPALERRNPLVLFDDGAGCRVERCDEHSRFHRPRRGRIRHQRAEMVVVRCRRPALQSRHRDGKNEPRCAKT